MIERTEIKQTVILAAKNNRLAQKRLFDLYHKEMLGLCIRMVGQTDIAEDVLQEGYIKAFSGLKKIREPEKFESWLKRILINLCISHIRKYRYFESLDELTIEDQEEELTGGYASLPFEVISKEIDRLPQGCRQIFTLYLLEDYKHKEIAEMLNLSVSTVKSQYQYALKLLRNQLKSSYHE